MCRGDRAAAAGKTSYSGEQMDRVGEWMTEQGVLAPSLSRDSKDGLALLLRAGCFVWVARGRRLVWLGNSTRMVLCVKAVLSTGARHWNGTCWLVGVTRPEQAS